MSKVIFNCTPTVPYSHESVATYVKALDKLEPGTVVEVDVRHDGKVGKCPNCGTPL